MNVIVNGSASGGRTPARKTTARVELLAIAPVFGQKPYFLERRIQPRVDCYRRLSRGAYRSWYIEFSGAGRKRAERLYDPRLFERDSFPGFNRS